MITNVSPLATILAVDDTSESLALLVKILTAAGYRVRPADSGELALAAVAAHPPDLILLDVRMKGLDGLEVCRRLKAREETRHIPIILISAFADATEWVEGLQRGAADYITKPFQTEELLTRVETHLALGRAKVSLEHQADALREANEQLHSEIVRRQGVEDELRRNLDRAAHSRRAMLSALEDQKRAEAARRQGEERHRITLLSVGDGVIATDGAGRVEILNPVAETLTGWSSADAYGTPLDEVFRILNEDTRQPVESPVARVLREGQVVGLANHTLLMARDGTERPIADSGAPIRDERGVITGVALVFRDQTEERAATAAIQALVVRQEALLFAIPDIVMEVNTSKVYTWANQAGIAFFGKDVIGRTAADYFIGEQGTYRMVEPLFRGDESLIQLESWQRRHDGEARLLAWRCRVLKNPAGQMTGALSSARDITEQRAMEQERIALETQLRQQQKLEAIGTLASGVAHEINNPINGIMNYAQLIADMAAPESQTAQYAGEIVHETERVATIVKNLLQFARQETQEHSPARLADIAERTLSLMRAVLRRDQITLTVEVPDDLPPLRCRSQQLQQVLMNLLTNARDALNAKYPGYDPNKTIRITAREVSDFCDLRLPICDLPNQETPAPQSQIANPKSQLVAGRWIRVTVEDRGTGIPPEIQGRIFDPFFSTKPRDQGTGLGLSISHGIVQDHHGRLHFETEPGQGTQFYLDLPVEEG